MELEAIILPGENFNRRILPNEQDTIIQGADITESCLVGGILHVRLPLDTTKLLPNLLLLHKLSWSLHRIIETVGFTPSNTQSIQTTLEDIRKCEVLVSAYGQKLGREAIPPLSEKTITWKPLPTVFNHAPEPASSALMVSSMAFLRRVIAESTYFFNISPPTANIFLSQSAIITASLAWARMEGINIEDALQQNSFKQLTGHNVKNFPFYTY